MSERRRVGLFGGSFNPPHICHVLASTYLLETTDLAEVWWLPVFGHAFAKDSQLAPWTHRLAMCEAVAADFPGIRVDRIEEGLGPTSLTINTAQALREEHPTTDFAWIVGSDLLSELPRWHRWEDLKNQVTFMVIGRASSAIELPEGGRFDVRDFELPDVSSTAVRLLASQGHMGRVRELVPAAVWTYLGEHVELYR